MDAAEVQHDGSSPSKKVKSNPNALNSLRDHTVVVADTGKINDIQKFQPQDATTNPSLILEAAKLPEYQALIDDAIQKGIKSYQVSKQPVQKQPKRTNSRKKKDEPETKEIVEPELPQFNFNTLNPEEQKIVIGMITDQLSVNFGLEILKLVPGYVSTEVDARMSYDKQATIDKAKRIINLYEQAGITKERILIKIASTWEGIQAAKALKKEGIQCNMTLIFNYYQALACAQAGVRLISPFVGRILDWFTKNKSGEDYSKQNHPGVKLVTSIWNSFKKFKYDTIVMAASLRLVDEATELCGCDRMTIPIKLLNDLQSLEGTILEPKLKVENLDNLNIEKVIVDEKTYRWEMNQDAMGTEKLNEGIRKFAQDLETLENVIKQKLTQNNQ
ncbi:unnamed protein product [Paramecium pentaurelia]|uniref:Transaldolase n=1 Tax=Paramecium pentaurelia TaxID=43138 RepID=A0A8S1XQ83_9CILI|nr:unnamed protein product [Paramecium pentaurelia]